jgi:uncharacterized damage-inducible protein DinB
VTEKELYLDVFDREFETTTRVLKAYPSGRLDLRPHEKSRTARDLAWTFPDEEAVIESVIAGEVSFEHDKTVPGTLDAIVREYGRVHTEMRERVARMTDEMFEAKIPFPEGPGRMGQMRRADILWMLLLDQIHHRGQFSVYLRMAGGRVPSIYGPSADEPWE